MTVVSKGVSLVQVRGRGQNSVPQYCSVDECDTEYRVKNTGLVTSLPMRRVQHIIFDFCTQIRTVSVGEFSPFIGVPEFVTKWQAGESRVMCCVETV